MLIFYRYFDLYTTAGNPPAFFDIVGIFKSPIYKNSVGQQTDTPNDTTTPLRLCGSILYQITNLNFICTHSPSIFLDFQGVSAFGVLAVTPFLHHFRIWLYWISSDYTISLKLLDGIIQRFGSHMNIPIHCCFDAGMTE